ncbi:MAG: glutamate--tRNA ligase family protein [Halobacteriovoraceae bacterium]|nr:glutamate--tRNA ligase family protein [Halobacteriovoraceae bacterium]
MSKATVISRLAPTPSGYLHLGNILNFYLTWKKVRENNGILWLRIDDMDTERLRPSYVEDIFRTLEWLKIDYDEGPSGPDDFYKNFSQQKKIEYYRDKVKNIQDCFNCVCGRKERKKRLDSCQGKNLNFTKGKTVTRVVTSRDITMGDFVVWRKNNLPSWILTCVIDDYDMGVNLIVRGEDLLESSEAQIFLVEKLGLNMEMEYLYHKLITDKKGKKLSKSKGASIKSLREQKTPPSEVMQKILGYEK